MLQKAIKGWIFRRRYLKLKAAALVFQKHFRARGYRSRYLKIKNGYQRLQVSYCFGIFTDKKFTFKFVYSQNYDPGNWLLNISQDEHALSASKHYAEGICPVQKDSLVEFTLSFTSKNSTRPSLKSKENKTRLKRLKG